MAWAVLLLVCAFVGAVCAGPLLPAFVPGTVNYLATGPVAPLMTPSATPINNQYMVVLKRDVAPAAFVQHHERIQGAQAAANQFWDAQGAESHAGVRHVYDLDTHLLGYAGVFSGDVLAYIRAQPEVDFVERDTEVQAAVMAQGTEHVREMPAKAVAEALRLPWQNPFVHETEVNAPWGLARISHRKGLTLGTFNKYVFEAPSGEGVVAYVIDTGIQTTHEDFGGRAVWGVTIPQGEADADMHGHGTHCAGTIGSTTYGVAKNAELVAVKVLGSHGQGSMSDVTAGVLWAVADARARTKELRANPRSRAAKKHRGFVANMSLGGGKSPILDRAVDGAVAAGLHFAVAAGNENQDACNVSPARASRPVTVGASTIADQRAYFSNVGPCVDVFGPGLNILSTWNTGVRSINTMSGTSMAAPHVVGLLAYLLSIYGSTDFAVLDAPAKAAATRSWAMQLLQRVHPLLPTALAPVLDALAPSGSDKLTIASVLSPSDLKSVLSDFASADVLDGLATDTANKLVFNNATRQAT